MVGAGAAGKVEGQVVVLDLVAAERVHGGEMVTEAHAQVQVVAGQDGVAGPAQAGVLLGPRPGSHEREEVGAAQADGARPVDARVAEAAPQGDKGHAGDIVGAHRIAGGQPVAQAAAHVQGVDNERHVHLQAHRVLGAADGLAQVEHLPHRHLVAVADDVVHGAAVVRSELLRIRVGEVERRDLIEQPLQPRVRRGVKDRPLEAVGLGQERFDPAPEDPLPARPQGDLVALVERGGGGARVEQGGHAELARHRGQVAGRAADVGDQAAHPARPGGERGGGGAGHEDGVRVDGGRVRPVEQPHPARGHAAGGAAAAFEQERVIGVVGGGFAVLLFVLGENEQGPHLQDDRRPGRIHGPLDVQRPAGVRLQAQSVPGEFGEEGRRCGGRAARPGQGFRDEGVLGDPVHPLRRGLAAHQLIAQTADAADAQAVRLAGGGVRGVEHAAGLRIDHGEHEHGHGRVPVVQAVVHAVGQGRGRVEAGDHPLPGRGQFVRLHPEERGVLAGERDVAVLADGRTAHRQSPGAQGRGRLGQGPADILGHRCGCDPGEDLLAHRGQALGVVVLQVGEQGVDPRAQAGRVEKAAAGHGGHGEAVRGAQTEGVAHVAEVRGLGPGQVQPVAVDPVQGQHQFGPCLRPRPGPG